MEMIETPSDPKTTTSIPLTIHDCAFSKVPAFSKRDVAYVDEDPALKPFFKYPVRLEAFEQVLKDKGQEAIDRNTLVAVLQEQYSKFAPQAEVMANIERLKEPNSFTVVTAHQPSLFTGPLYYIYKIVSTINLAEQLNATYPAYHFVPVFITGGEDHDFEEVNHAHVFNKTLLWENEEKGSVGMMKTDSLKPSLAAVKEILGESENAQKLYALLERTHSQHDVYSDAMIDLVHELFKQEGLVVINMNHAQLKALFRPIIKEEIFQQASAPLVEATAAKLEEVGFKQQATAREINFFYLRDQLRERIVKEGANFQVLNTDYVFSEAEMLAEIEQFPERFSPNVIMRPIYQEKVLPNLAYIGGGGEIAYWLERQSQFEHFGINFPMLIRRDSVLWIDGGNAKKMKKLNLSLEELLLEEEALVKHYVKREADEPLNLAVSKTQLEDLYAHIKTTAEKVDPTLAKAVMAEQAKQLKVIEQLEGRLVRAEKQKHETAIKQIRGLKAKLFPNNGLQERYDNFLPFYLKHGDGFIQALRAHLDPLKRKMTVIVE